MPKSKKKLSLNYCKAVVIVHGKSEYLMVQHIKSSLHLPIEIYAKKKGNNSIQITSLMLVLNNSIFKTKKSLERNYDIEKEKNKYKNFKIFTIMDTDDCNEKNKKNILIKKCLKNMNYMIIYILYII